MNIIIIQYTVKCIKYMFINTYIISLITYIIYTLYMVYIIKYINVIYNVTKMCIYKCMNAIYK